jgi:hypothetical protein
MDRKKTVSPKIDRKENNAARAVMESKELLEKSPTLEELKLNRYFTFEDGSLNYALVLKVYKSIYESEEINMQNLFLYFDAHHATSIRIDDGGESGLDLYFKHDSVEHGIHVSCEYENYFTYMNYFVNAMPKFKHLENLELVSHPSEWNEALLRKERKLPNSGTWTYLKKTDSIIVDDVKKELPISCKEFHAPNLTGLTPNYLKHVEILGLISPPSNHNQLELIKSMKNLKELRHRDEDFAEVFEENLEDFALFLDYKEGKMDKIEAVIEELKKDIKKLKKTKIHTPVYKEEKEVKKYHFDPSDKKQNAMMEKEHFLNYKIRQENIKIREEYDKALTALRKSIDDKTNYMNSLRNHEFFYNYHKKREDEDPNVLALYIELYSLSIENEFAIICDA